MIVQLYRKLFPPTPLPVSLTEREQRDLASSAWRLECAIREFLYHHGYSGTQVHENKNFPKANCKACKELQDALDEA